MKRRRFLRADTKVWHDPLVNPASAKRANGTARAATATSEPSAAENDSPSSSSRRRVAKPRREGARIIAGPPPERDPKELERERLLGRLLAAEGRPSISESVDAFLAGGFELPDDQAVWLQLLEHKDEERVADAIAQLTRLLEDQAPERRAVLESRLRRIEELADEASTKAAAADLRRVIATRYAATLSS